VGFLAVASHGVLLFHSGREKWPPFPLFFPLPHGLTRPCFFCLGETSSRDPSSNLLPIKSPRHFSQEISLFRPPEKRPLLSPSQPHFWLGSLSPLACHLPGFWNARKWHVLARSLPGPWPQIGTAINVWGERGWDSSPSSTTRLEFFLILAELGDGRTFHKWSSSSLPKQVRIHD
jgi:hypothetical protein